jgi:NAD(P)H-hydrate repair Nnr-like enzyme with NAD(P)H-hydrate dehydratase domain
VLKNGRKIVIDADALNIIAKDNRLIDQIPQGSLLTPHPSEFKRLFGFGVEDADFIQKGRDLAFDLGIHIIAKNKYSTYFSAEGEVIVGDLGNPSLAQGGSGDLLTGAIAAWWAKTDCVKTAVIAGQYALGR